MSTTPPPSAESLARHQVVSSDEWVAARRELLKQEKELTRLRDRVSAARRELPWVKIEKTYVFEGAGGRVKLADLFAGRSQLFVQHFMLGPGWKEGCPGCSFTADHVDAARQHFEHGDLSFAAVSRAPWVEIEPFQKRMGWHFPWVSSYGSSFNFDFHVSFTPEQIASERTFYNYEEITGNDMEELPGASVFYRNEAGEIFHTYSSYARGGEELIGAFNYLDLVPKGRNEHTIMEWVRHHDRYEDAAPACCGGK
jgi:predicted dithiol-disulfide oxidoreductase (DUF899 family)